MSDLRKIEAMQTKYADINNLSKDEVQEVYGFFLDMKAKFSGLAFHCRNHLSLMKDAELAELRVKLAAMEGR